ncbi:MAG: FecR domain-containing protein [Caulobacteraceae bacterium]|nr:FecR domain-containing protein [Caulobacteraceae bacterium]
MAPDGPVEEASAWCLRLSEGSLTADEQERFDAWLQADDAHRQAFDDSIRAWRAVEQAAVTPELVHMRTAALTTFRRGQRARWAPMAARSPWSILAATVVVAVFLVGTGIWIKGSPRSYQTAVGERRVVVLSDGSKISLDAASKVEVRYLSGRRDLRLDYGRAKFTVAKNPNRPFTVAAADKVVLATGTEFSVELLRGQVQIILYQGHVAVLDKAVGSAQPRHVVLANAVTGAPADQTLTPGRELVVPVAAQSAQVIPVDSVRTLSWEGGQLVFVDEPLSSAVERVNRYSDEKIAIGDGAVGRVLISGVFTAGDTPAFIEGVTGVFPIQLRDDDGRKVLVGKGG